MAAKKPAAKRTAAKKSAKRSAAQKPAAVTPQVSRSRSTTSEPVPSQNQTDETGQKAEALDYKPRHLTPSSAGVDQHEVEAKRQAQLEEERNEHNRRTGDVSR